MLKDLEREGKDTQSFKTATLSIFYSQCLAYLNEWTVHFEEMQNFNWILLQELIRWTVVKETHTFILERRPNLHIDDNALFDEVTLLKNV